MTALPLWVWAALSGLLQVLVFPKFSIYPLAAVAVAPLIFAVARARSRRERFLLGWLSGAVYWGGACYWVYGVMHDYADLAAPAAAAIFIAFLLVKGLHLGVFGLAAAPLARSAWAIPALAALWVAIEGTHQYLGFTWLHLGNAAAGMSVVAPLAPYTGVYGPSFVLMLINAALASIFLGQPRRRLLWLAPLLLLYLPPRLPEDERGDRLARLVQPAVHPDELISGSWNAAKHQRHLREMVALSTSDDDEPLDLLVWPEYSVPAYFLDSPPTRDFFEAVARRVGAAFIFNSITFTTVDGERRPRNGAVILGSDGELLGLYSKIHLVPFGEFVPWPFSRFIDKITLQAGDFAAGDAVVVAEANGHKLSAYICYENVFARGVREFVAGGAEVLVNISNDSWYGRTSARYQHLLIARMRAIENQRYILRATADGVTTIINRAGQITPPPPSFRPGVLRAYFSYSSEMTWYALYGEWFWIVCCAGAAAAIVSARRSAASSATI